MPTLECLHEATLNTKAELERGHKRFDVLEEDLKALSRERREDMLVMNEKLDALSQGAKADMIEMRKMLDDLVAMQHTFLGMEKLGRFLGAVLGGIGVVVGVVTGGITVAKAMGWVKG